MTAGIWFMPFAGNFRNPYFDPEILLGSVLDGLRRKEALDAYADRMRIVVEDVDRGFYAAFDPGD